ncbi:hypothetical protein [Novosphingobium sp. JCM 18896]|uniref:hypothetical protein n=1 Tax=Novosphingobium sp. JCM 18896 TaxID=2989731 RepID=UPI00222156AE|nr:hypothetical protein [Novosphingobium sp. JCM 18896]MCW1432411.1 hypothetical protein [Novosphingobium sp. JCM 18896]
MKYIPNSAFQAGGSASDPILQQKISIQHPCVGRVDVEFHPDGLPVRHVITHGGRIVSGVHPSVKMGRGMPWSSVGERALVRHLDYQFNCQGFLVQPCAIRWRENGKPQVRFPDAIAEIDHQIWIYEGKHIHPNVYDRSHEQKNVIPLEIYRALGWQFQLKTTSMMTSNAEELINQQSLFRNQFVRFDHVHEIIVRDALTEGGNVMLLCSLIERLSRAVNIPAETAESMILAMAVRRLVRFNMKRRISPVSPVYLVAPRAAGMKILNFWEKPND